MQFGSALQNHVLFCFDRQYELLDFVDNVWRGLLCIRGISPEQLASLNCLHVFHVLHYDTEAIYVMYGRPQLFPLSPEQPNTLVSVMVFTDNSFSLEPPELDCALRDFAGHIQREGGTVRLLCIESEFDLLVEGSPSASGKCRTDPVFPCSKASDEWTGLILLKNKDKWLERQDPHSLLIIENFFQDMYLVKMIPTEYPFVDGKIIDFPLEQMEKRFGLVPDAVKIHHISQVAGLLK